MKARTSREILRILTRKGFGAPERSRALSRLRDLGYVDDSRYAAEFTATTARAKAWGPARIRAELKKRGIPDDIADAALAGAEAGDSAESAEGVDPVRAVDRALARFTRGKGLPRDRKDRDRLRARLRRHGFSVAAIDEALRRAASEAAETGMGEES